MSVTMVPLDACVVASEGVSSAGDELVASVVKSQCLNERVMIQKSAKSCLQQQNRAITNAIKQTPTTPSHTAAASASSSSSSSASASASPLWWAALVDMVNDEVGAADDLLDRCNGIIADQTTDDVYSEFSDMSALVRFLHRKLSEANKARESVMKKALSLNHSPSTHDVRHNSNCSRCKADWGRTGPVCGLCRFNETITAYDMHVWEYSADQHAGAGGGGGGGGVQGHNRGAGGGGGAAAAAAAAADAAADAAEEQRLAVAASGNSNLSIGMAFSSAQQAAAFRTPTTTTRLLQTMLAYAKERASKEARAGRMNGWSVVSSAGGMMMKGSWGEAGLSSKDSASMCVELRLLRKMVDAQFNLLSGTL